MNTYKVTDKYGKEHRVNADSYSDDTMGRAVVFWTGNGRDGNWERVASFDKPVIAVVKL